MLASYFVHDTAVVDEGAVIGNDTKVWHFSHVMAGASIGVNCVLGQNVMVAKKVNIGAGVKIQNNVSIYEGVWVDDDVFIGPSVVFTNIKNPRSFINRKNQFFQTKIYKGASIGANATIICGNTIGNYAMVGAGSVVTKDVKAYSLVLGVPAKHVGWVSEYGQMLNFNLNQIAECSESKQKYILKNNQVVKLV